MLCCQMKQDSTYKCFPSSYYLVSTMKSQFIFKQQCTEKLSHPYLYGAFKNSDYVKAALLY